MLRRIAPFICNSRGQSIVEFALVLPLLLTIMLGIINFGLICYNFINVNEAAREGARAVAVSGKRADATTAVKNVNSSLTIKSVEMPTMAGGTLTVKVSGKVQLVDPVYSAFLTNPFPVNGQASMRLEVAPQ